MSVTNLISLIERLPPGRARRRYERLLGASGEVLVVTVSGADGPIWLVPDHPETLTAQGIPRSRIWTLTEAQEMLAACGSFAHSLTEAAQVFASPPPGA
jgi:hypothetical protein